MQKTEIWLGFGHKKSEPNMNRPNKFYIRTDGLPTETVCNPQFKLKVIKNYFTCI